MEEQGFTLETMANPRHVQLLGSNFRHTSLRELHMTDRIQAALGDILVGN